MSIVKIIKGDLIKLFKEGQFEVIAHGANCKNLMGAGIARQIQAELPEAFKADCDFYTRMGGVDNKACHAMAGHISSASVQVGEHVARVINLYTQIQTGKHADYQLLQSACEKLNAYCKQRSVTRVGLPLVGAGIGGLDVVAAATIISQATPDIDVTLVVWKDDTLNWKTLKSKFRNYGFPNLFDGLVIRTGQDSWKFYQRDVKIWNDVVMPIDSTEANWHDGEYAISFDQTKPEVWLLVSSTDDVDENVLRLL